MSSILFVKVKRKQVASLAPVLFIEMCMCGTYCFIKPFCIYESILVSPRYLVEEETGPQRFKCSCPQAQCWQASELEAKFPDQWSRPPSTRSHCWGSLLKGRIPSSFLVFSLQSPPFNILIFSSTASTLWRC